MRRTSPMRRPPRGYIPSGPPGTLNGCRRCTSQTRPAKRLSRASGVGSIRWIANREVSARSERPARLILLGQPVTQFRADAVRVEWRNAQMTGWRVWLLTHPGRAEKLALEAKPPVAEPVIDANNDDLSQAGEPRGSRDQPAREQDKVKVVSPMTRQHDHGVLTGLGE
jgi:hypothetical protein